MRIQTTCNIGIGYCIKRDCREIDSPMNRGDDAYVSSPPLKIKVLVKKYVGLAECPDFGTPKVVSYDYLMNFEVIII